MCMDEGLKYTWYLSLVLEAVLSDHLSTQTLEAHVAGDGYCTARVLLHLAAGPVTVLVLHVDMGALVQQNLYDGLVKIYG